MWRNISELGINMSILIFRQIGARSYESEKEYDDPIAHFQEIARKMTEEENSKKKLTLTINMLFQQQGTQ